MANRLKGKLALVTGGSRGIGAAVATAFVREGARVIICARKQPGLDETVARINAEIPGAAVARTCHVGQMQQVAELLSWIEREHGLVDVLVNNAGTNPHFGPLLSITPELWDKTFEVNLKGVFEPTRIVTQRWLDGRRKGAVVSIASIAGIQAAPLQGCYGMTKAAIISMTKTLAVELGPAGIRLNAIAPGVIETRLAAVLVQSPDILQIYQNHTALRRHGQPDEIAGMAVYLASDEASYVTGQTFCVDGGYSIA